jgi:hypothetical protein
MTRTIDLVPNLSSLGLDIINIWKKKYKDDFQELCTYLLLKTDETSNKELISGSMRTFISLKDLRKEFFDFVETNPLKEEIDKTIKAYGLNKHRRASREQTFTSFLDFLIKEDLVSYVYDRQRIRSRVFEIIHYLSNLRQRLNNKDSIDNSPRLVEMLKVEFKRRTRPKRDEDAQSVIGERISDLIMNEDSENAYTELLYDSDSALISIFKRFLDKIGFNKLAKFQLNSFFSLMSAAISDKPIYKSFIITAGTGFGKTEAFLFPILFFSTVRKILKSQKGKKGYDSLLIYPRRDLCDNQLERIIHYLYYLNQVRAEKSLPGSQEAIKVAIAHSGKYNLKIKCPVCMEEIDPLDEKEILKAFIFWDKEREEYIPKSTI